MKNVIIPALITCLLCVNDLSGQENYNWRDVINEDFKVIAADGTADDGTAH